MERTLSWLIAAADSGDRASAEELFETLYSELHRLAQRQIAGKGGGLTLGTTTLLHEAYVDMARRESVFPDRDRFMGYAARVMRTLIVNYARRRNAQKRGGQFFIAPLDADAPDRAAGHRELEQVSAAVDKLAVAEPELARIVDLKFFCGFTFAEIAAMRGVSERTVQRQWDKARIFLRGVMRVP